MEVKIVLGHAFGDEGKGVTVQWLCKQALAEGKRPCVVRFSGGPQAGHTIVNNGVEHICSSFGSGALLGVDTWLMPDVYVDPICLMNEREALKAKGIVPPPVFYDTNMVITPYDVIAGQNDEKVRSDGTCGKGLYATYRKYNAHGDRLHFLNDPDIYLEFARSFHRMKEMPEYDEMFRRAFQDLKKEGDEVVDFTFDEEYDVLIFEGSQGLLLDMDCGFYPHVTPSYTGLNGISLRYLQDAEVYLVTRTYTTRHGNGYMPKFPLRGDLSWKHETNVCNEFQGKFKTGMLEIPPLSQAYHRHHLDNFAAKYGCKFNLVITHMDVPMRLGRFALAESGDIWQENNPTPENVAGMIATALQYDINKRFYNDSVESNLKEV